MWEALTSSNLATPEDPNGIHTDQILDRFRQHQSQNRRFSVAPSMINRFIQKNLDPLEQPFQLGSAPHPPPPINNPIYDPIRRRHSLASTSFNSPSQKSLIDQFENINIANHIHEIDDYFDNAESRVRAWSEAGKNLQINSIPPSTSPTNTPSNTIHSANSPSHFSAVGGNYPHRFPLYVIEFKAGRTDYFYIPDDSVPPLKIGDLAIVEADRGKDLGKVIETNIQSYDELKLYQSTHPDIIIDTHQQNKDVHPKRIFRTAQPPEIALLLTKSQDEAKAMGVCQVKIRQKKLPMEIVDAEYQWDRRKLTFYFVSEHRVDFRELVRELFKIYKTRIWMCAVSQRSQ